MRVKSSGGETILFARRISQRVLNRVFHIGYAELRDDRAVNHFDHRMNDRLRMHDDAEISSAPKSKSQCASMTSNPLFIKVAESIVILSPIFQFG